MSCPENLIDSQEPIKHQAIRFYSVDQAEELLQDSKPFTYLLIPLDSRNQSHSFILCFFNEKKIFHKHLIQSIQTEKGPKWRNGSGRVFKNIEEVIPFSMGVISGTEKPFG